MKDFKAELQELQNDLRELIGRAPEIGKFAEFVQLAEESSTLSSKTKELITVGIAIAIRCEPCIMWHIDAALRSGATPEEIVDTIKVAVAMGGGPALMYGIKALEILQSLTQ